MPPKKPVVTKPGTKTTVTKAGIKTTTAKPGTKTTPAKGTSTVTKGTGAVPKDATAGGATSAPKTEEAKPIKTIITPKTIGLKDITKVIFAVEGAELSEAADVAEKAGKEYKDSKRWLYVIDNNGMVSTFLKYRDTNMITANSPTEFLTEKIRQGILGALCFGKPFIIDISDKDGDNIMDEIKKKFNEIYDGLYNDVMDRSFIEEDKCMKITNNSDASDYGHYYNYRVSDMQFVILTKTESSKVSQSEEIKDYFYPIIVT